MGRRWVAPPGSSLLASIVLRRPIPSVLLTALCAVATAEVIDAATALPAKIKWPNDVMIHDKKVCGVLTEVLGQVDHPTTVVGIGVNVNLDPSTAGLPSAATSLSAEIGKELDRASLLRQLLGRADDYLTLDDASLQSVVWTRWEALLWRRGQAVRLQQEDLTLYGVVEGISSTGLLRLRNPKGELLEVAVGDLGGI